ncbi:MAG: hypothetical protein RL701_5916 [Pseudomonadota bacterium]
MSDASSRTPPRSSRWSLLLHLFAFVLPVLTASFWLSAPHSPGAALLWILPLLALYAVDRLAPAERRQPEAHLRNWPYNLQLYALAAFQLGNHALLIFTASKLAMHDAPSSLHTLAMFAASALLAGTSSAYAGVSVAHELVHRPRAIEHTLGRLLLAGVLYEHYSTEHIRGHHVHVGTDADPATARFGETHWHFVKRTVPAQFASAWRVENARMGKLPRTPFGWLKHRVLQGMLVEVALLTAITCVFGWIALVFFVTQAMISVLMLETVNYVEHWGLTRRRKKVLPIDSWDTDNAFTLYTLIGLGRHSDHHAKASRPFQALHYYAETAQLPSGYYSTLMKALLRNARYRELATAELKRKHLGPFRPENHTAFDAGAGTPEHTIRTNIWAS